MVFLTQCQFMKDMPFLMLFFGWILLVAILHLPEVMLGVLPGGGGLERLPALTGTMNTLDMALTGKSLNAKKAKKVGLVDSVVDSLGPGLLPADVNTHQYLEKIAIDT